MSANIRELISGFSFKKQADLVTPCVATDIWNLLRSNQAMADIQLGTESDANDIGRGHEFASQLFKTGKDVTVPFEAYLTSQNAAQFFAFALGKLTKTAPASGAFQYTMVPLPPVTDGIDMPVMTYVEAIRQGSTPVIDRACLAMAVNELSFNMTTGPGRSNTRMSASLVGTGKTAQPSTITIPAAFAEASLNAGGAAVTINGVNYVSGANLVSLDFSWRNNMRLDSGYFPGSGSQDGFAIRGRMEHGDRSTSLSIVARFAEDSTELDTLMDQTEGTAVWSVTGPLITGTTYHKLQCTHHRTRFRTATVGNTDGIVTVQVDVESLYHSSNGLLTAVVITDQDNVLTAAA